MKALVAAGLLTISACGTDGFFEVISPVAPGGFGDGCPSSSAKTIATLEVGTLDTAGTGDFLVLDEGSPVDVVQGTQGADMIVLALRITGVTGMTCLAQRTDVYDGGGERISYNALPKNFTEQPDGSSVSGAIYFPGNYQAGAAKIEVTAGGRSLTRSVEVVP